MFFQHAELMTSLTPRVAGPAPCSLYCQGGGFGMAKPNISELKEVLTEQDWQWSPHFRITPLRSSDIKKVIAEFYSATDKWIDEVEASYRQSSSQNGHGKEHGLSQAKRDCEEKRGKCRDVLMSYTHAGMRKPFAVRHRRLLEVLGIFGLWRSHNNLWYFAIAWQFNEWYDHVLKSMRTFKTTNLRT